MSLATRVNRYADPVDAAQRELDVLFGRFFGNANGNQVTPYAVDVRETVDTLTVEAELPGFTKDQLDITLENSVLTISAERKIEAPATNDQTPAPEYLLRERRYTKFQRSFRLPQTVDGSTVNAKLENGILTVSLNKRQETKPRKITVA